MATSERLKRLERMREKYEKLATEYEDSGHPQKAEKMRAAADRCFAALRRGRE